MKHLAIRFEPLPRCGHIPPRGAHTMLPICSRRDIDESCDRPDGEQCPFDANGRRTAEEIDRSIDGRGPEEDLASRTFDYAVETAEAVREKIEAEGYEKYLQTGGDPRD